MLFEMRSFLVLTFVGVLAISGCGNDNATGPDKKDDTISIKLVTPDSGLKADTETDFVVTVEYVLASADSGELLIGFNSVEVGRYHMISSATALIAKGSGEHQFNVSVVTRDWGGAAGDFAVYVNLSEHPHAFSWTPLATDIRVLIF
jgi:hypothetical protein